MFTENKVVQNTMLQLKWKISKHQPKIMALLIINVLLVLIGGMSASQTFTYSGSAEINIAVYSVLAYLFLGSLIMFIYGSISNAPLEWKVVSYLPMNRTTGLLSNVLFLLLVSLLNTILTFSNVYISALFHSITFDGAWVFNPENGVSLSAVLIVFVLYFMVTSLGYLLASIAEVSKLLMLITIAFVFWLVFRMSYIVIMLEWLVDGGTFAFIAKCLLITVAAFASAFFLTRNQEVNA